MRETACKEVRPNLPFFTAESQSHGENLEAVRTKRAGFCQAIGFLCVSVTPW